MELELEVDEGLYVGGLDLDDDKDHNDDEECLDEKRVQEPSLWLHKVRQLLLRPIPLVAHQTPTEQQR